ncbi:MAG: hypothetical protein EX330_13840, partial [Candidatus Brocadia sp. BROELEC01]
MYLYKDLNSLPVKGITLAEYFRKFSFHTYVHRDKQKQYFKSRAEDTSWLADIAASVTAKLFAQTQGGTLIKDALRCCRDILLSKGYLETNFSKMHNGATSLSSVAHIVLVPGCQSDSILESRMSTALSLIREIHTNVDLVFIGHAPPSVTVRIPDESARMMAIYEDRLRKDDSLKQMYKNFSSVVKRRPDKSPPIYRMSCIKTVVVIGKPNLGNIQRPGNTP